MMADLELQALQGELLKHAPLAQYTSWRSGGVADYVYLPKDLQDLSSFLSRVPEEMPITWLGLGSNTLIRDGGVAGLVIVTQGALNQIEERSPMHIRAEAGVASAKLARFTARLGATGLEFLAGIPGTIGGALAMNAGCFGGETWQFVESVEVMNRHGEVTLHPASAFSVSYRHVERDPNEWFVAGHFKLLPGDREASLESIRALLERRSATQPTGTANCGSVFRNPPGDFSGRLIEQCGLKGKMIGGAHVSEKHANFIINDNHATSEDIERLIAFVGDTVEKQTGVRLIPEVCVIGRKT